MLFSLSKYKAFKAYAFNPQGHFKLINPYMISFVCGIF